MLDYRRAAVAGVLVSSTLCAYADDTSNLGSVHFPNSGALEAQGAFLRGVAALHSFWYEEAATAFQEAQEIDPGFALAYWGEALTHDHPLWDQQERDEALAVLERLAPTVEERLERAATERERGLLSSVEILFGEGERDARDVAYSDALGRLHGEYPDDLEIASLYALSLLGRVPRGESDVRLHMRAAAIAGEVMRRQPNHPGAAHYLIHAVDDPLHAPLGLHAARRYAEIAPEAHHARHMPSHIFLQLGMWHEAEASNISAVAASEAWVERRDLEPDKIDLHSLAWQAYAELQLGKRRAARSALLRAKAIAAQTGSERSQGVFAGMWSRHGIETGEWVGDAPDVEAISDRWGTRDGLHYALGFRAVGEGRLEVAEEKIAALAASREAIAEDPESYRDEDSLKIMELELLALVAAAREDADAALAHLAEAVALEAEEEAPRGPTWPAKPASELFGEMLLEQDRPAAAVAQFEASLLRTPRRTASLLGLARSLGASGEIGRAVETYRVLLDNWTEADPSVLEKAEARAWSEREAAGH